MKDFEAFEKELIDVLVNDLSDNAEKNVKQLFKLIARDYKINISFNYEYSTLLFTDDFGPINCFIQLDGVPIGSEKKEILEIRNKCVIILSLLDYLEKLNLIYLYKECDDRIPEEVLHGKKNVNKKYKPRKYFGNILSNAILEKSKYTIFAKHSLYEFVENGYKTAEEKRHEENMNKQKLAIYLALLFGVVSLIISGFGIFIPIFIDYFKSLK